MAARYPVWSRIGRELFFLRLGDDHLMFAGATTKGEAFSPDRPVEWSSVPSVRSGNYIAYDLAPDGKRMITIPPLFADSAGEKSSVPMTVLRNYFDELKRKVSLKP